MKEGDNGGNKFISDAITGQNNIYCHLSFKIVLSRVLREWALSLHLSSCQISSICDLWKYPFNLQIHLVSKTD